MLNKDSDARLNKARAIPKKGSQSHLCALLAAIFSLAFAKSIRKVLPFHEFSGDIAVDRDGDLTTKLYVAQVDNDGKIRTINE